ncbi:MAG: RelA/SpoT domain-containing protein [Campylobacter sp.]|nr:RelA/SpoT domain-containing protein [Campylobacter sp.]
MSAKVSLELSKNQIKNVGIALRENRDFNIEIINSFRGLHEPLMRNLVASIKKKSPQPFIIARRLKRLSSIKKKFQRFETMNLARIQDIAGVRCIFKTINQLEHFSISMKNTYERNSKSFLLEKEFDYLKSPKLDGYRGIYQIYRYVKGNYISSIGLCAELQLRTLLQHYWATAVEVLGLRTSSNIKLGYGDEYYKEFFRLSSVCFSRIEALPCIEGYENISNIDLCKNIMKLDDEYNIFKTTLCISSDFQKYQ